MKKTIIAALITLLSHPTAQADIFNEAYAGIKVGYSDYLDQDCNNSSFSCEKKDLALGLYAGHYFKDWFAVEATYSKLGSTYATAAIARPVFTATDVTEISVAPRFDIMLSDNWSMFTKVGLAYVDINTQGQFYSTGKSDWVPTFGVGSEYILAKDWRLRFDMSTTSTLKSYTFEDVSPIFWGVGLTYRPSLVSQVIPEPAKNIAPQPIAKLESKIIPKPEPTPLPFSQRIYFEHGKSEVLNRTALYELISVLKSRTHENITLIGHTDSSGKAEYNLKFGLKRAESIKAFLVQQGIDPAKIKTTSLGDSSPSADNNTLEGRALNRFVEIRSRP
ncbi:TPA: OmpA family protein [Vibrio vulnificus]